MHVCCSHRVVNAITQRKLPLIPSAGVADGIQPGQRKGHEIASVPLAAAMTIGGAGRRCIDALLEGSWKRRQRGRAEGVQPSSIVALLVCGEVTDKGARL